MPRRPRRRRRRRTRRGRRPRGRRRRPLLLVHVVVLVNVVVLLVGVLPGWFLSPSSLNFFLDLNRLKNIEDADEIRVGVTSSLRSQLLGSEVAEEERDGLLAVDLEPVGADEVLLVEHGVVRAQEAEILELKTKREEEIQ